MKKCLVWLLLGLQAPFATACPGLEFERLWVREPPPGARGTAAYFKLRNAGTQPAVLGDWSSANFGQVMLHETVMTGDRAEMRHRATLELAPGDSAALRPGGLHLMLMQPANALVSGQEVSIDFKCNGASGQIRLPVQQEAPSGP